LRITKTAILFMELDDVQRASQEQFARRSHRYGKGHILENVDDVREAVKLMSLPQRAEVLDMATGGGHTGLFLASLGHKVVLSDIAQPMLDRAMAVATERVLEVQTRLHPAEEFPYQDATFDLITCRIAPHHFSSPEKFVRECARTLRAGGYLLVIDGTVEDGQPEAEAWMHELEKLRDPSHNRLVRPGEWKQMCETSGLHVEHASIQRLKQPDLNWYFDTAATPAENRKKVLELVANPPESARNLFQIGNEEGKIVWWWQRLVLIARKPT